MAKSKPPLLGDELRKIQPKLRMIANGSAVVNTIRAEHSSAIAVRNKSLLKNIEPVIGNFAMPCKRTELPKRGKKGELHSVSSDVIANVFISTVGSEKEKKTFPGEKVRKGNLVIATLPVSEIKKLSMEKGVSYIELGDSLSAPEPEISTDHVDSPTPKKFGSERNRPQGEDVIIGIIDVQGFDFAHPDFLDDKGNTRFLRIWDQGGDTRPSPYEQEPGRYGKEFDFGAQLTEDHMNAALRNAAKVGVPPQDLERQSQMVESSHGTHVSSIAAGNNGICPKAKIAAVLIALKDDDMERRKSFYDSTRLAQAVDYLLEVAEEKKMPISINISLGTNGHAHDASAPVSRWIDSAMAVPGRCICVAAGNAGQEKSEFDGDIGYVMGRIHTSGQIAARGLHNDIEWIVVGNGIADLSENEMEIWYSAQDRFTVSVKPPEMDWLDPILPHQYIENKQLKDGSFVSVYNELYHPANGNNYISIYLSPFFSRDGAVGVPAGKWIVRLEGLEIRNGKYHGWIERDDPRRLGKVGVKEAWRFPSFFSEESNVDNSSVSSLACGQRIISVVNLDEVRERINITSSQGPTRDSRQKPDTAAPGTDIVAARGFAGEDDLWVKMTGTSMASPFVCGVAGLMLGVQPKLTSAQIEGIIQSTARPLPGSDFNWTNKAGFGRIDPDACLIEAAKVNLRKDITK